MNLEDFIKQVLIGIAGGVSETQYILKETNAVVNPSVLKDGYICDTGKRKVIDVNFDVAVTVNEDGVKDKGLKINVMNFVSAEVGKDTKTTNQTISRISFSVPFALPILDTLSEEAKKKQISNLRNILSMI